MDHSIISIREFVQQAVAELGGSQAVARGEALLCRDDFVVGHRFNFDGVRVVWFADQDEVAIHGSDGQILRTLRLTDQPINRAA